MTDRIKRHLSGWRAAALPTVAVLALAALLAACAPDEEFVLPPPILLNDPPPPIHIGGEPYPPGTISPAAVEFWEMETNALMQRGSSWNERTSYYKQFRTGPRTSEVCVFQSVAILVRDQWILTYDDKIEDPEAAIAAELREAGWEFESVTVRTREYYDERYDPEVFHNWLAPHNQQFDPIVALERLGGEVHPERATDFTSLNGLGGARNVDLHRYQVSLQRPPDGNLTPLPHAHGIKFTVEDEACSASTSRADLLYWLVGGFYTTFGDDIVWSDMVLEAEP